MNKILRSIVIVILKLESRLILRKYKPKIVAITGSVGKTSTKDMVYTAMSNSLYVRKSEKSYNTEFGVPLTIIDRPNSWNNVPLVSSKPKRFPAWLNAWHGKPPVTTSTFP